MPDMPSKLKANLKAQLQKASKSDLLDVVLELVPELSGGKVSKAPQSRAEMIAAKKKAFDRSVTGVEEAVKKAGGKITGSAWLNQTVRALIPAGSVKKLCSHEKVVALDTPRALKPESL